MIATVEELFANKRKKHKMRSMIEILGNVWSCEIVQLFRETHFMNNVAKQINGWKKQLVNTKKLSGYYRESLMKIIHLVHYLYKDCVVKPNRGETPRKTNIEKRKTNGL